jgi:hypothetical protein
MAKSDETLAQQVALRLNDEDLARLEALAARIRTVSRNTIARAALRLGLDALEADPSRAVEEDDAETLERIHALRAEGLTLRAIAERLTAEGHQTKRGGEWAGETVRKLLDRALPPPPPRRAPSKRGRKPR